MTEKEKKNELKNLKCKICNVEMDVTDSVESGDGDDIWKITKLKCPSCGKKSTIMSQLVEVPMPSRLLTDVIGINLSEEKIKKNDRQYEKYLNDD